MPHRFAGAMLVLLLAGHGFIAPAWAWSIKEHAQLTRLAAERLVADPTTPAALKKGLQAGNPFALDEDGERAYLLTKRIGLIPRGADGFPYWATIPDLNGLTEPMDRPVEPFGVHEKH